MPHHAYEPLNLGFGVTCYDSSSRGSAVGSWTHGSNAAALAACKALGAGRCVAWKSVGGSYLLLSHIVPHVPDASAAQSDLGTCFQPAELVAKNAAAVAALAPTHACMFSFLFALSCPTFPHICS